MTSSSIRELWAKSVFSNFSLRSCIHAEDAVAKHASDSDEALASFAAANSQRRRARVNQQDAGPALDRLADVAEQLSTAAPGSSDALLGAIAFRTIFCAAGYAPRWSPQNGKSRDWRQYSLDSASSLISARTDTDEKWLFEEATASVLVAQLNQAVESGSDPGSAPMAYESLLAGHDLYVPAFFDRANKLRRLRDAGAITLEASELLSYYRATVQASERVAVELAPSRKSALVGSGFSDGDEDADFGFQLATAQLSEAGALAQGAAEALDELDRDRFLVRSLR